MWVFENFLGTLLQVAFCPFSWIGKGMGEVSEKVGKMPSVDASQDGTDEDPAEQVDDDNTITGVTKKYP